jgi:flagellar hook-associated protein 3 FlgL
MRVSFMQLQQAFLDALGRQQGELARVQTQVATGQRYSSPAEDPVAATQALGIDAMLASTSQYARNADQARNRLGLAEGALSGVGELLQRVRELVLQAANGPQSRESRALIAAEVRERLDELVQLANTRDGSGDYLFAGYSSRTQPFVRTGSSVGYQGDQGQRLVEIGPDRFVADSDSGASVFQLIRNGNGTFAVAASAANAGGVVAGERTVVDPAQYDGGSYTVTFTSPTSWQVTDASNAVIASGAYSPGSSITFRGLSMGFQGAPVAGDSFAVTPAANQSVFATVQSFLDGLALPGGSATANAAVLNTFNNVLYDLDQGLGRVLEVRAAIGSRLNAIDAQQLVASNATIELKRTVSGLRDTDYAEALTRLNQQMVTLEAAQKSFARTQGLSLFDYL